MGNDVSSQIPLSITPYTKCQNCKKVNDLFLVKNVYHILKRIHNNKKEQKLSYFLDTCECIKKTDNIIDVSDSSEQTELDKIWRHEKRPLPQRGKPGVLPTKATLTQYMCKILLKCNYSKIKSDSSFYETLKPTDKEYIEFLYIYKYSYVPTTKTIAWDHHTFVELNQPYTFEESNIQNTAFTGTRNESMASNNPCVSFRLIYEYDCFNNAIMTDIPLQNTQYYKRLVIDGLDSIHLV